MVDGMGAAEGAAQRAGIEAMAAEVEVGLTAVAAAGLGAGAAAGRAAGWVEGNLAGAAAEAAAEMLGVGMEGEEARMAEVAAGMVMEVEVAAAGGNRWWRRR